MPSAVYYIKTTDGEPLPSLSDKLRRILHKSGISSVVGREDFVGIKLHFGEKGNTGYIRPELVKVVADHVRQTAQNVFLTDTNVLYKKSMRTNSVDHLKIAAEHGFDMARAGVPILIADGLCGRNFTEVPINKRHFSSVKIASDIANCDSLLVLTHVTGHMQTGLGGALKNLGMGCASRRGKYEQHSSAVPEVDTSACKGCGLCAASCPMSAVRIRKGKAGIIKNICISCGECAIVCRTSAIDIKWSETLENLQEKMVEYAYGAAKNFNKKIFFVSFLMNITKNCDCMSMGEPGIAGDIGILASGDPVAIDKASVDLIIGACGSDIFKKGHPKTDWAIHLKYANTLGLGEIDYTLERL